MPPTEFRWAASPFPRQQNAKMSESGRSTETLLVHTTAGSLTTEGNHLVVRDGAGNLVDSVPLTFTFDGTAHPISAQVDGGFIGGAAGLATGCVLGATAAGVVSAPPHCCSVRAPGRLCGWRTAGRFRCLAARDRCRRPRRRRGERPAVHHPAERAACREEVVAAETGSARLPLSGKAGRSVRRGQRPAAVSLPSVPRRSARGRRRSSPRAGGPRSSRPRTRSCSDARAHRGRPWRTEGPRTPARR